MMLKWRMPPWRKSLLLLLFTAEALGPSRVAPLPDVAHLLEEANKALGDLLVIKP